MCASLVGRVASAAAVVAWWRASDLTWVPRLKGHAEGDTERDLTCCNIITTINRVCVSFPFPMINAPAVSSYTIPFALLLPPLIICPAPVRGGHEARTRCI